MGCCGQRRTAPRVSKAPVAPPPASMSQPAPTVTPPAPKPSAPPAGHTPVMRPRGEVQLEYLESSRISVAGPITNRPYEFSAAQRVQTVDSRDAEVLLRTRFFRAKR
jgi:hypothetical protein